MKLRNAFAAAVGTAGLTALANRVLARRAREFEPFLEGDQGSYRWRGFDIAYTEAGDPANPDLLLLHGISAASSNHEFYAVFEALAEEYHVIAPDLPGFGHSDRPPLLFSAAMYTTFVRDAIRDLSDDEPIVVASSLTGAYAVQAVEEATIDSLVLVCPTGTTTGSRRTWLRALLRSPIVGLGLFNLLASKPAIRHFHAEHGYSDVENLPADVLEYEWLTAHQSGARFAPASFVSGYLDLEYPLEAALAEVDVPVTLVWGRDADLPPLERGRELAEAADAGLVVFDHARLLPHAEHPEKFVDVVLGEVAVEH